MTAHPSDLAGGYAYHQRIVRHIFSDYRACSDESVPPDCDSADHRGVSADSASPLKYRLFIKRMTDHLRTGISDIGQHA